MKRSKATLLVYKYDPDAAHASLYVKDLVRFQAKKHLYMAGDVLLVIVQMRLGTQVCM